MIRLHTIQDGAYHRTEISSAAGLDGLAGPFWVEVVSPNEDQIEILHLALGLHPLAMTDALRPGHPPKLEDFGDHLFLIAHTPARDQKGRTRKISLFLSKTWLVTVLRVPLAHAEELEQRVIQDPGYYLSTTAHLAQAFLDQMAMGFERMVDHLSDRVEELEEEALARPSTETMNAILAVRKEVAEMRRVVRGQRDVCLAASREGHPVIPEQLRPYFRDVYDHVSRVSDLLESLRDSVGAARDAYLSAVNNRLSEIMRVLTVIATIMMPLSLIAGVFGMNFVDMPGLAFGAVGFWVTMAVMLFIAGSMLLYFKRHKWL